MAEQDLVRKYAQRLQQELGTTGKDFANPITSKEYQQFRKEIVPATHTLFEKLCLKSAKILAIGVKPEKKAKLQEHLDIAHLAITPEHVMSLAIVLPIITVIFGILFSIIVLQSLFFVLFFIMIGIGMYAVVLKWPEFLANNWRLQASNQMVQSVFYVVTYMRHTSNLELAIQFAADHLSPPLSLDLRKVLWNVETEKFPSIKESLDEYLESWRKWNKEFIEAFHLIESSLYENDNKRRLLLLDKSLDLMLQETYEKMLHYAHNLKSPITTLHMMGIILPVLGLVILPLLVSFIDGVRWIHVAALYNVLIPVIVYLMGKNILSTRPTGYGSKDITEKNPLLKKYKNVIIKLGKKEMSFNPIYFSLVLGGTLLFLGIIPLLLHLFVPSFDIAFGSFGKLLEYRESITQAGEIVGPYGIGASIISLLIPIALGLSIGLYFKLQSKNVIKIRDKAKQLEGEFASALFQLGNRLGDGLPAEAAFGRVAAMMPDTVSGQFFGLVSANIRKKGMGLHQAIFDPKNGALVHYPSNVIESSMKVLIESIKKGPAIAAQALNNVSRYIKEIHAVNERLKDLMADIISDMKSQIHFLTPTIAGIVIGITSMITTILGSLSTQIDKLTAEGSGGITGVASLFGDGIPTYYFQIVVGVYVVQIIYVLTIMSNGIENGADKLSERYALGRNLIKSTILYVVIGFFVMIIFNFIASKILTSTIGG
jgi:hypothetical protein